MEKDFLKELEFVGFTARIKRISDHLMYDARKVYENLDIGIEPNWHLIFLLLKQEEQLTVTEIAQHLNFSHPAVIKIIKKMKEKGYIESITDRKDSRRQLLQLSGKSKKELPLFEKEWELIETIIQEFVDLELLEKISILERKLGDKGLFDRHHDMISQ